MSYYKLCVFTYLCEPSFTAYGSTITVPLDNATDDYWFYVPNNTSKSFDVSFVLKSPAGINYDLQWVRVNSNSKIYSLGNVYDNGGNLYVFI